MNYLEQIKGFWIAQEVNQLGTSEIALYFYLLEVGNKTGWTGTFNRNNYKVMGDLSIKSYKTFQSVRDKLKTAGIISVKQSNGNANPEYELADLSKFYRGSGKGFSKTDTKLGKNYRGSGQGLGKGLVEGLGKGLGKVNINQTKPNQTKPSFPREKSRGQKKSSDEKCLYWQQFIDCFATWYKQQFGSDYAFARQDFRQMKNIHQFLERRAAAKKFEFTEENLLAAFKFFLNSAWNKDQWLRDNFSISNLLKQFNQIANGQSNSKAGKPATGANVSTASILSKIVSMPD